MANYQDLGVRPVINALGTYTRMGGSLMPPQVVEAMARAGEGFVDMGELQIQAGRRVAELVRSEAAMVTAGAAAGIALATAAAMTRGQPDAALRLPDTDGLPGNVLIFRGHRYPFERSIPLTGARLVEIAPAHPADTASLERAFDASTAAVLYVASFSEAGALPLSTVIQVARAANVPVIVDAADDLPPASNLWTFTEMGADAVIFSGGKALRGPQPTGLLLGKRWLIEAAWPHASPREGVIGRPMKVGKEEIVGLVTALELYLQQDTAAEAERWEAQVVHIVQALSGIPGVNVRRLGPDEPGIGPLMIPQAVIELDDELGLTPSDALRRLREGEPPVVAGTKGNAILANPQVLQPGEEYIVAEQLRTVLTQGGRG